MAPAPCLPRGARSSPNPLPASTSGLVATSPALLQALRSSSLSPDAHPFLSLGRSMSQRWVDSTLPESSDEELSPTRAYFHDVLLSCPAPSKQAPKLASPVASSHLAPCYAHGGLLFSAPLKLARMGGVWSSGDAPSAASPPATPTVEVSLLTYEANVSIASPCIMPPSAVVVHAARSSGTDPMAVVLAHSVKATQPTSTSCCIVSGLAAAPCLVGCNHNGGPRPLVFTRRHAGPGVDDGDQGCTRLRPPHHRPTLTPLWNP
jgi:hypothetical protein